MKRGKLKNKDLNKYILKKGGEKMEEWKTIELYPEYEVSSYGNIRSKNRTYIDSMGRKYDKIGQNLKLVTQTTKGNYNQIMVCLWSQHKMHRLIVARLVAQAFIPNPNNLPQVNHKDENSENNNVANLEWCTAAYNVNYNNLRERAAAKKCRCVAIYDIDGKFIEICNSGKEAAEKYCVSRGSISACCNGSRDSVKGYRFKFV